MFKQALKVNNMVRLDLWSDGPILRFEWIITVIKYKLITRNRFWNTGAVTQKSLQNSSLGNLCIF